MLIAFNKPFGVLSQFTDDGSGNRTLAEFKFPKNVYPIGRLDADSEGLLLLSDEPSLNESLHRHHHFCSCGASGAVLSWSPPLLAMLAKNLFTRLSSTMADCVNSI